VVAHNDRDMVAVDLFGPPPRLAVEIERWADEFRNSLIEIAELGGLTETVNLRVVDHNRGVYSWVLIAQKGDT